MFSHMRRISCESGTSKNSNLKEGNCENIHKEREKGVGEEEEEGGERRGGGGELLTAAGSLKILNRPFKKLGR